MRTLLLILIIAFAACNPAIEKEVAEPIGAGFFLPEEGEKFVVASDSVTDVWMRYIEAHNNKDINAIMAMNSDSITIHGPDGAVIEGKENHEMALNAWFPAENPNWKVYWAMPYKGVTGGAEWIVAGHEVTLTQEGQKNVQLHMIDAEIENGKVRQCYVYSKDIPKPAKEDME